jgi:hypothetical protein
VHSAIVPAHYHRDHLTVPDDIGQCIGNVWIDFIHRSVLSLISAEHKSNRLLKAAFGKMQCKPRPFETRYRRFFKAMESLSTHKFLKK